MAKKNNPAATRTPWAERLKQVACSSRFRFVAGVLTLLTASVYALAYTSFVFDTGAKDQAILEHLSGLALVRPGNGVHNWAGAIGAFMAEYTINRWLGVSVLLFDFFLFRLGVRLLRGLSIRGLGGIFVRSALGAIWLSAVLGFLFVGSYQSTFLYLGGRHGYDLAQVMRATLGVPGTVLLLVALGLILSLFCFASTMDRVRSLFGLKARWEAYRAERRRVAAEARERDEADRLAREAALREAAASAAPQAATGDILQPAFAPGEAADGPDAGGMGQRPPSGDGPVIGSVPGHPSGEESPNGSVSGQPSGDGSFAGSVSGQPSGDGSFTSSVSGQPSAAEPIVIFSQGASGDDPETTGFGPGQSSDTQPSAGFAQGQPTGAQPIVIFGQGPAEDGQGGEGQAEAYRSAAEGPGTTPAAHPAYVVPTQVEAAGAEGAPKYAPEVQPTDGEPEADDPETQPAPGVPSTPTGGSHAGAQTSAHDPNFVIQQGKAETVATPIAADKPEADHGDYDPTKDLEFYEFPGFELLKTYDSTIPIDEEEQYANKEKIKNTLASYGVEIQSITATVGPTITLFEIVPVNGTRIARVRNLSDEIAMSIAATAGIRIIAPIPGKSAIGIEVPNRDPQVVSMRDCITSRAFQEARMELPVALGKTIMGDIFTFDLAKAPHLLVAGATGQGKSVGLNAIITSLLYRKHPAQLKIVLVDPKMVEFSIYRRIERHYLARLADEENPIITDITKVVATLQSVCAEMEDRYALVQDAGVRNIKEYNEKFVRRQLNPKRHVTAPIGSRDGCCHHYLPYIVVIVDEYGDLIMTAGKEVELPIARIAQKARAVGIHMIIATQRPSAKIVTGLIKANFPARIAFRVSSGIDSSIILDQPGAQNLIGRGDLLYSTGNAPVRVQCAFVDTPEVDGIARFIEKQQAYPSAFILPEPRPQEGDAVEGDAADVDLHHLDPLFADAAQLVVSTGQGSTSMIQRKCGIGYARAGRIMDQLEAAGIVGPYTGSKARSVLVESDSELQGIIDSLRQG